jgi:hypothetical protein
MYLTLKFVWQRSGINSLVFLPWTALTTLNQILWEGPPQSTGAVGAYVKTRREGLSPIITFACNDSGRLENPHPEKTSCDFIQGPTENKPSVLP